MPLLFCDECNHMLYPQEQIVDREVEGENGPVIERSSELIYECRSCQHSVRAADPALGLAHPNMVTNKILQTDTLVSSHSMPDEVTSDPTLPRTRFTRCEKCGKTEAVFYQSTSSGVEAMTLFFVCCNSKCHHRWKGKTK